jgi:hypothetical protein
VSEAPTQGPQEEEHPAKEQGPPPMPPRGESPEDTWWVLLVSCVLMVGSILAGILGVL